MHQDQKQWNKQLLKKLKNWVQKTKHKNALFFLFASLSLSASTISCNSVVSNYDNRVQITKVIDGDTFSDKNNNVYRILGIDAPETYDSKNHFSPTNGFQYFYGTKAKEYVKKILRND